MGKNSIHNEFDNIEKLGIFNPRLNCVFLKKINEISNDVIETVSKEVIGYNSKNKKMVSSDELTVADVMRELQCTRYMVMKYYSEKGLPLKKVNNKYYITKAELYEWIIEIEEERKRQEKITIITLIISIVVCVIIFGVLLLKVF